MPCLNSLLRRVLLNLCKYLGSTICNGLKGELNVDTIVKKAQQRLFFLRRLRSFGLTSQIMLSFDEAAIKIVLTFHVTVCIWFGSFMMNG